MAQGVIAENPEVLVEMQVNRRRLNTRVVERFDNDSASSDLFTDGAVGKDHAGHASVTVVQPQMTHFRTDDLAPTDRYKLMTGLITPRPIGWVGTVSADGVPNLAPYSFFNGVSASPPVIYFSTGIVGGHRKDSLANAEATGEFTINIVSMDTAEAMNGSSATVDVDVNEFDLVGLSVRPSQVIGAPGVAEAKAILECTVVGTHTFGDDEMGYVMTLGQVVHFSIDETVLDGTRIDSAALDSVGRLAGNNYATTRDQFSLERPL